jgi:hypothetical protein
MELLIITPLIRFACSAFSTLSLNRTCEAYAIAGGGAPDVRWLFAEGERTPGRAGITPRLGEKLLMTADDAPLRFAAIDWRSSVADDSPHY